MKFNARRTLKTDRRANAYVTDPFVVEHTSGLIVHTCLTWREAIIWRDRFETDERAAQDELAAVAV